MDNKIYRRRVTAWVMYDWANSAFATTVMAGLLPAFYQTVAGAGLPDGHATAYWGYTVSAALLIAAVISPVLGALSDFRGTKKRFLINFMLMGVCGTALLYFVGTGDWLRASVFFILANVGFAGANVFYDALLPHVARAEEVDQVSARGFAMGYLGGGLLLAVNLWMILQAPEAEAARMIRLAFVSVAVWWLVFTIPLWRYAPEPQRRTLPGEAGQNAWTVSFRRLAGTLREISKYPDLFKFMLAVLLYTDGIGTIIKMGVAYGAEIGIRTETLVGVLLAIQFVAMPFSFLFGRLASKYGAKRLIYVGLLVYTGLTLGAYFVKTDTHFWLLGLGIATVQGGTQAMTRSLGARMIPKSKSGEFFGFVSVLIKFAGMVGPLLFALVAQAVGSSRPAFLSLVVFFLGGMFVLSRVDEEAGVQAAQEVNGGG